MKVCFYFFVALFTLLASGCDTDEDFYSPKPKGYIRLQFPEKKYLVYTSDCPFEFEIPDYSRMVPNNSKSAEPCWFNLEFPAYRATLHLSYKPVNNNLAQFLDDAHDIANRHQIKATGLDEIPVIRDSARVFGLMFDIAGNTASSVQFYLTDSTHHFMRGSLYFNTVPNIDSLKIVVDYLRKDIVHLINTTRWQTNKIN